MITIYPAKLVSTNAGSCRFEFVKVCQLFSSISPRIKAIKPRFMGRTVTERIIRGYRISSLPCVIGRQRSEEKVA